jgi:hypothetical protein
MASSRRQRRSSSAAADVRLPPPPPPPYPAASTPSTIAVDGRVRYATRKDLPNESMRAHSAAERNGAAPAGGAFAERTPRKRSKPAASPAGTVCVVRFGSRKAVATFLKLTGDDRNALQRLAGSECRNVVTVLAVVNRPTDPPDIAGIVTPQRSARSSFADIDRGLLRSDAFWSLVGHAVRGMRFLHANGVVHGDITPEHIAIDAQTNGSPIAVLTHLDAATAVGGRSRGGGRPWYALQPPSVPTDPLQDRFALVMTVYATIDPAVGHHVDGGAPAAVIDAYVAVKRPDIRTQWQRFQFVHHFVLRLEPYRPQWPLVAERFGLDPW